MKKNLFILLSGICLSVAPVAAHADEAAYRQQLRSEIKSQIAAEDVIISKKDPTLIGKSVKTCGEFADQRNSLIHQGIAAAITAVGGSIGAVAFSSNAANGDEAMALGLSSTGTTAVAGDIQAGAMAYEGFQIALSFRDFSRLAYELGNDQEGLVTNTYLSSCMGSAQLACMTSLEVLKRQAKLGTMCDGWLKEAQQSEK